MLCTSYDLTDERSDFRRYVRRVICASLQVSEGTWLSVQEKSFISQYYRNFYYHWVRRNILTDKMGLVIIGQLENYCRKPHTWSMWAMAFLFCHSKSRMRNTRRRIKLVGLLPKEYLSKTKTLSSRIETLGQVRWLSDKLHDYDCCWSSAANYVRSFLNT